MKHLILITAIILSCLTTFAQGQKKIKGYVKSNGTYVESHYRTNANKKVSDNWSTKPNVNPYTGKVGTKTYNTDSKRKRN